MPVEIPLDDGTRVTITGPAANDGGDAIVHALEQALVLARRVAGHHQAA